MKHFQKEEGRPNGPAAAALIASSDESIRPLRNVESVLRNPAWGTTASQTGSIVELVTQVVVMTESSKEKQLARALYADPNVVSVRHQALKINYVDDDGNTCFHIVDLVATLRDGTRIGYVVKPEAAAVAKNVLALVGKLAASVPSSKIDRLQLVTSRQLPEWGNQNSRQLLNARRDRRTEVDDELNEIAPKLVEPIRIDELSNRLGGGKVAYRPILRALGFGTLVYLGKGVIDENGSVKYSGTLRPDLDELLADTLDPRLHGDEPPIIHRPKNKNTKLRASVSRR